MQPATDIDVAPALHTIRFKISGGKRYPLAKCRNRAAALTAGSHFTGAKHVRRACQLHGACHPVGAIGRGFCRRGLNQTVLG